jgi:glycosyltransferase involved in cell wall biosynthesis
MAKKLIIGIDIRDLRIAKAGTRTSLEEISKNFMLLNGKDCIVYLFDTNIPVYTGHIKALKLIEHVRFQIWKQVMLPIKAWSKKCDIVFCNDYFVPYFRLGFKTIPVFHDAFFYEYPEHYNKIWLFIFKKLAVPAARKASFVIAQSKYSKERVHHFTRIEYNKIIPVYVAPKQLNDVTETTQLFGNPVLQQLNTEYKYILHVGTIEKRKNLPALIKAFALIKKQNNNSLKLVLAGQRSTKIYNHDFEEVQKTIQDFDLKDDVIIPGYLSNEDLSLLYTKALIYVFPSINEGFGVPVLEAFRFQIPTLVSNNTCLPEIGGDAVISFDPFNINDIASKIELVLKNEELRLQLIEKGNERLKDFSWEKTTSHLLSIFERAVKE